MKWDPNQIQVQQVTYHRNGISGASFHTVEFIDPWDDQKYVGIVFEEVDHIAVINLADPSMSYRGDRFEDVLRATVASHR